MSVPAPVDKRKNIEFHKFDEPHGSDIFLTAHVRSLLSKHNFGGVVSVPRGAMFIRPVPVGWGKYPGAIFHEVRADAICHH